MNASLIADKGAGLIMNWNSCRPCVFVLGHAWHFIPSCFIWPSSNISHANHFLFVYKMCCKFQQVELCVARKSIDPQQWHVCIPKPCLLEVECNYIKHILFCFVLFCLFVCLFVCLFFGLFCCFLTISTLNVVSVFGSSIKGTCADLQPNTPTFFETWRFWCQKSYYSIECFM